MAYTLVVTINLYQLALICAVLVGFGVLYNRWVGHVEQHDLDRGFMSLIVSIGCAITVAGFAVVSNPWLALALLACFAASGTPMIVGSILRYVQARAAAEAERDRQGLEHLQGD